MLLLTISVSAQDYHPLVKESSSWSVLSGGFGSFMKVCCIMTQQYRIDGDTTIDSKHYKKLWLSEDEGQSDWETIGFLHENSYLKQVWLRDNEGKEGLIYDFSKQAGEEVTLYNPLLYDTMTYQITLADSMAFGNEYRKVITIYAHGYEEEWIEGIGSKNGIVYSNLLGLSGGFRELLCFSDEDIDYINPWFNTCFLTELSPKITSREIPEGTMNQEYYFQVQITDVAPEDTLIFFLMADDLPLGVSLDKNKGIISGIPVESGTFYMYIGLKNNNYITDILMDEMIIHANTGVHATDQMDICRLYLDPDNNILLIRSPYPAGISIINLTGQVWSRQFISKGESAIRIEDLDSGLYFIQVISTGNNNNQMIYKFLIP